MPLSGLILLVHLGQGLHLLELSSAEAEADALLRESEEHEAEARP